MSFSRCSQNTLYHTLISLFTKTTHPTLLAQLFSFANGNLFDDEARAGYIFLWSAAILEQNMLGYGKFIVHCIAALFALHKLLRGALLESHVSVQTVSLVLLSPIGPL